MAAPLDKTDLEALDTSASALKEVDEIIKRGEQAGIDMTARKERRRIAGDRILSIKRAFFPRAKAD